MVPYLHSQIHLYSVRSADVTVRAQTFPTADLVPHSNTRHKTYYLFVAVIQITDCWAVTCSVVPVYQNTEQHDVAFHVLYSTTREISVTWYCLLLRATLPSGFDFRLCSYTQRTERETITWSCTAEVKKAQRFVLTFRHRASSI